MIESFTLRAEAQRFISHSGTVHRLLHLCQDSRVGTLCHALCTPGAQKDAPIGGDQPFITPWSLFHGNTSIRLSALISEAVASERTLATRWLDYKDRGNGLVF